MNPFVQAFRQRAARSLGQHFLIDQCALQDITRASLAGPDRVVIEIGPGPGSLTHAILSTGARVVAIEKDRRAVRFLQGQFRDMIGDDASDRFTVIEGDALKSDFVAHLRPFGAPPFLAVGNLPYNISTAILSRFLDVSSEFERLTFMFQREVALRLVAKPNSKAYGSLSLAVQARTRGLLSQSLGPEAFVPPPKVDSAVVTFDTLSTPKLSEELRKPFETVARAAFSKRRKTIRNSLKFALGSLSSEELDELLLRAEIDPRHRAEQLSFEQFSALTVAYLQHNNSRVQES